MAAVSPNYRHSVGNILTWPEVPLGANGPCSVVSGSAGVLELRLGQARLLHCGPEGALLSQVRVDVLPYSESVMSF